MAKSNTEISIRENYNKAVDAYMNAWCDKHELEYEADMWVAGDVGTICMVGDYFVSFDEVRYDMDNDLPGDTFFEWYDYSLDVHDVNPDIKLNFRSYCMGYRPYNEEEMERMREARKRIRELEAEIEEIANQYKKQ